MNECSLLDNIQNDPKIHIRIQKRNSKKSITIIQGLPAGTAPKILATLRKKVCCGGNLLNENSGAEVIQLQGDVRIVASKYLSSVGYDMKNIIIHGF